MTADTRLSATDLDALFAPYAARPVTLSPDAIREREKRLDFGWEFARLQGAVMTDATRRLFELYVCGQIDSAEYRKLGLILAERGALSPTHETSHADGR